MYLTYDEYKKEVERLGSKLFEWQIKKDYELLMLSLSGDVNKVRNKIREIVTNDIFYETGRFN